MAHANSRIENDNSLTLAAYQAKTQAYIDGTPMGDGSLRSWLDEILAVVAKDAAILEIGSGLGRDAAYIQSRGYAITCTDAVPNFIATLRDQGFVTHPLNILQDNIRGGPYDLILANAVLQHFSPSETEHVLDKIHAALKPNGIFACTQKKGNAAVWSNEKLGMPRYFHYWQPESFQKLTDCHGFEWFAMSECHTAYNNLYWMLITLRKNPLIDF